MGLFVLMPELRFEFASIKADLLLCSLDSPIWSNSPSCCSLKCTAFPLAAAELSDCIYFVSFFAGLLLAAG